MLSDYLRSKAEWRRRQEKDYPNDSRHDRSADALVSLADYVDGPEVSPTALDRLRPHLFDEDTLGGERTWRAVSRYGLGTIITPDHHVAFLDELAVLCELDAYGYVREHGEDRTHTLVAFEIEAAKEGASLPRRYFERRLDSTQGELKKAVDGYRSSGSEAE